MTNLSKKVLAAISAGSMLLSIVSPVAAQTTLEISGNGADSTSDIRLKQDSDTYVTQSNSANITNNVSASADSGKNDANRNTGGDVTIDTGNAKTDVSVSNSVNSNTASVDCCAAGDTNVLISGNGANSDNDVKLKQDSDVVINQDNKARIKNNVDADANTGKNDANRNTGGDVQVLTGKATTLVDVSNTANANYASVGGDGSGGSVDARIVGNGSYSDNDIKLRLDNDTYLKQNNNARIYNDVDADANSGKNDANRNTGGDVLIDTGDAKVDVDVDNMVNFNWADVDCGCLLDVFAKIAGNGDHSDNEIKAKLEGDLTVFQDNCKPKERGWEWFWWSKKHRDECKLDNDVYADADTGKNDANKNTGSPEGGDPEIMTGNADAFVDVSNSGNSNVYGVAPDFEWPDFDFNFNLRLDLNWGDLLALLGN